MNKRGNIQVGRIQLEGRKFGNLTVVSEEEPKWHNRYWKCLCSCGNVLSICQVHLLSGRTKACKACTPKGPREARADPTPLGGSGYVRVHGGGYAHRCIMEQILGRKLLLSETVHHRNGIRHDNRPENLELWCCDHSKGQRVRDLVAFAKDVLRNYDPQSLRPAALSSPK